jgi:hypothetical protein
MNRGRLYACVVAIVVCAGLPAAASAFTAKKGDVIVVWSGSGSQKYSFNVPEFPGRNGGCEFASNTGTVTDSFHWSYTFAFTSGGRKLHQTSSGGGMTTSDQTIGPCNGPGRSLDCSTTLQPDKHPAGNFDTGQRDSITVQTEFGVNVSGYGDPQCNGNALENPYNLFRKLDGSVKFAPAELSIRAETSVPIHVSVKHSCDATICGYQPCRNEPGSAQPGAGAVTCKVDNKFTGKLQIRVQK